MFQNEDWSSDEEYSQYLDDKAREFFSLDDKNEETKFPAKKRKLDNEQKSTTSDNKEESNKIGIRFNENPKQCFENTISSENDENIQSSRRKMVLDIFYKKNVQNVTDSTVSVSNIFTPTRSPIENILNREKSKGNCNDSEIKLQKLNSYPNKSFLDNTVSDKNDYNEKSIIRKNIYKEREELENIEEQINEKINNNVHDISPSSRKSLLTQHLKPSTSFNKMFLNDTKSSSSIFNIEKQSNKKTALVRKFPGPAGLLPDFIDTSTLPTSHLINVEDSKDESVQDQKNNSLAKYCSQNTKTLFSEGAWQIMLNDLPAEFLKNYQIAEVKKIASTNQHRSIKIPFLAGIIESIDYSHENPPIVLKDFTDQIEGTLHADIPATYPGAFDKNVVLLLQNVGLLCISGTFIIHKYHILISPSNLLAIYSNVGDIIRTPHMELLKNKFSMTNEFNSANLSPLQDNNYEIEENSCNNIIDISQEGSLSSEKVGNKICKNQNLSHNSNIDTHSNEKPSLPLLQTFSTNTNIVQNRDNIKNAAAACKNKSANISLQNIDKTTINKNIAGSKNNVLVKENKENLVKYNDSLSVGVPTDASSKYFTDQNTNCSDNRENNKNKCKLSRLEKLAGFKSKYVLTSEKSISGDTDLPSENVVQNNNNKLDNKQTPLINDYWSANIFCDSNNDSDDEMLSQLDVDSIST
ncbi:PREDICTED: putative uncharacterized protein DDB_G0282133 [Polistes dominula]|uniref:Homologous recombination OB-fold protein OB-fold domain-containing protein n=1 Tax=Polistes dominula TaxID=743375 RepID=A0ABM1IH47_POLDO|nr:PREDICTED: putative uncharacterized protein DDB_G0282133 [Polistes dominula]